MRHRRELMIRTDNESGGSPFRASDEGEAGPTD